MFKDISSSIFSYESRDFVPAMLQVILASLTVSMIGMCLTSCKKIVRIDPPVDSITTEGAFSNEATANAAVAGIYSKLINSDVVLKFGSGGTTLFAGLSADELSAVGLPNPRDPLSQFYTNELLPNNDDINQIWTSAYFAIYQANSSIEGLTNSNAISSSIKTGLIGECKFLRAFSLFYLTNLFGDIPLPLSSDWINTYLLRKSSKSEIYQQVINDLKDAQEMLPEDYGTSNRERIRANKYAATALLARVYLYQKDWQNAENQATIVIKNASTYSLVADLNKVFLKNSTEAILQFQPNANIDPFAVTEQFYVNVRSFYLTDSILNAFESSDKRKSAWIKKDSTTFPGIKFSYPAKYKVSYGNPGSITEYYMVLRLAEQYLIRAEARVYLGNPAGAVSDLNAIRNRAGLAAYSGGTNQEALLTTILHERQVELFAEWGHRWLDLIRTERANAVLASLKGASWQSTDQLYPIPQLEILNNPNLTQNLGY
jgi:hypothetical protein